MYATDLLEKLVMVLLTAVLVVPVFARLHLSAVLGYLAAGAVIGPHGLALIADPERVAGLAEFGVVFLLFTIGLELSVERLRAMRRLIFGLGAAQVGVCGLALAGAAWALGLPPEAALIAGSALALSSTAVVLQVLSEQGDLIARVGRISFAVLLFQDLAVAPLLALVPLLAQPGESLPLVLALAALKAVAALGAIVLIGRLLLRPLFRLVAASGNREVFAAMVLLVALGTGWATQEVGLSMALGAFLAGLLLAGTEYRHQVAADIEPYRGILLGLFFMTVGMMVDPSLLLAEAATIGLLVAGLLAAKAGGIAALCRLFGIPLPLAARLGLQLAQGGEFAFVIFGLAVTQGVLAPADGQRLIVVVALSMALTPLLSIGGRRLAAALERRSAWSESLLAEEARDLRDHVIIAGFGRVGQTVTHLLAAREVPHLALDIDVGRVAAARRAGSMVFYGNASQLEVLRAAGVAQARAVVVTLNQPRLAERIVKVLHDSYPNLPILARAHDRAHSAALEKAGATLVVPETLEASLQLGHAVLKSVGTPADDIVRTLDRARARAYAVLDDIIPASGGPPPPG